MQAEKSHDRIVEDPGYETSSGNIFADLGLEDAAELEAKATLAQIIRERIRARGLTQVEAAALFQTHQSKVSQVMNGKIAQFTYDRLLRFLNALDCDFEIRIVPRNEKSGCAHQASHAVSAAE